MIFADETRSDVKLKKVLSVDRDEICEGVLVNDYNRSTAFCTHRNEVPCIGDGPVMGIDAYDVDKPYWYVVGFYSYGPIACNRFENRPKVMVKIVPFLDWINNIINREDE